MTSSEKCEEVVAEVSEILESYDMFEHDSETIIEAIEYAYYLLGESYRIGNLMEKYIKDELGEEGYIKFTKQMLGNG